MLNILIDNGRQNMSDYESYVSDYFDDVYEKAWFLDEFIQKIITDIDCTEVKSDYVLYNETLGEIPPQYLSSGCKALILLYKEDCKINGDRLGDNCIELLLKIAQEKDIYVSFSHIPRFPECFEAYILNTEELIHTKKEFVLLYVREM